MLSFWARRHLTGASRAHLTRRAETVMASSEQIKALLRSHAEGDDERFYAVALQVAAQAARQGHGRLAQELRELVDTARAEKAAPAPVGPPVPVAQPRGELAGLISVGYPKVRFADMVLSDDIRARLERLVCEQRQREKLRAHGLRPAHRVLLVGPPGSGKTMTAAALAGEMHLPLFTILIDGLITKFMGETAAKLRLVFEAIGRTRGIYLFDEFDAIGGHRTLGNDVGEIRRVLNSFLQFLEQDQSDSLIVAATNHVELLDRALFRRFDEVIEYALPAQEPTERVCRLRLAAFDTTRVRWAKIAEAAVGLNYGEIVKACEDVAKSAVLRDETSIAGEDLCRALELRRSIQR
jgi:SpoVK/Ycf46/Vps4 family AAA+-type ATPase